MDCQITNQISTCFSLIGELGQMPALVPPFAHLPSFHLLFDGSALVVAAALRLL